MFKKFSSLLILSLIFITTSSWAIIFPAKPSAGNFYVDEAKVLTSQATQEINKIAGDVLKANQIPIVVVTIKSLHQQDADGYTVDRYAKAVFDAWGLGSAKRNDGVLMMVSIADRHARITLGKAWGLQYDHEAKQIMDNLMIPAFKKGNYAEGIVAGVRGLEAMVRGQEIPKAQQPWWQILLTVLAGIIIVCSIISLFRSGRHGWAWLLIALLGGFIWFILSHAGHNDGHSGDTFAGGSSGDGGASGSW